MPLISYIYYASMQISAAISPDERSSAFKEVAIVRHPRIGQYTFGFITSTVVLQKTSGEELCCVHIPTNHLYLGYILPMNSKDVMRPNLSVREGIGMSFTIKKNTASGIFLRITVAKDKKLIRIIQ
ncbi:LIKE COV 3-like [Olea europaea subsp. europaea]|uniref:LIKE COV 3-like n=1 Tax=Olea europaea subsp. europaea TaxID=158383 RepID=A0A8S0TCF7_OLEEU|nr:LIKE COV 3-like [Olea europaea subsp. europaea]